MRRGLELMGILAAMAMEPGMQQIQQRRVKRPKPGWLDEYELIRQKKSKLSANERANIVRYIDDMVERGLLVRKEDGSVTDEIIVELGK